MGKIIFRIRTEKSATEKTGTEKKDFPIIMVYYAFDKQKKYTLPFKCKVHDWSTDAQQVKKTDIHAQSKNSIILNYKNKADNAMYQIAKQELNLDIDTFDRYFQNKPIAEVVKLSPSYYDFVEKEIELRKGKIGNSMIKQYKVELSKLKNFKSTLNFDEIDYNFLRNYEYHLRNNLNNKTNTVAKAFKNFKIFINEAIKQEIIIKSPFINYTVSKEKTNREFLSIDEIKQAVDLYKSALLTDSLQVVLQYYLFSCFTGLRFQDIINLTWQNIEGNSIKVQTMKTGQTVLNPLPKIAQSLLPERKSNSNDKIFKTISNQKTNDYQNRE